MRICQIPRRGKCQSANAQRRIHTEPSKLKSPKTLTTLGNRAGKFPQIYEKQRVFDTQRPQKRGSGRVDRSPPQREAAVCNTKRSGKYIRTRIPLRETRSRTGRDAGRGKKKGNEEGEQGRLHTGEVGPHGAHDVGVPEVAVALAEMHLLEVGLRRRHRRCLRGSPIWGGGRPVGLCFASTGEGRGRGRVGLGWGVRASGFGREGPDLTWQ